MEQIKYFLSYSRQNSDFVTKLAADLKKAGTNVWLDQIDIVPGMRWDDSIQNALNESGGLLIALSADSVKSQNVMDEISFAISNGKRIVPLVIEPCSVPFRMARYQHIDFSGDYDTAIQQLLKTLNTEHSSPPDAAPVSKSSLLNKSQSLEWEKNAAKYRLVTRLTGILFIILAVVITLFIKCPTNVQYFTIYTLIGVGIALLLAKNAEKSSANVTILNIGIALGGGVALPFILFFTNPIGSFKPDDCNTHLSYTSITVFVHSKKSKQDMILRQKGFVIMDVNGERKKASINENGQAFFPNLNIGDSVRIEIDFSEPYRSVNPDSVYVIQSNSKIYLPVELEGIDMVQGMVLYNDTVLTGVTVKLAPVGRTGFLLDTTDQTGSYSFTVPEQMQTKEYQVWFIKEGFKTRSFPAFPQTGRPLNIVMEKK